MLRNTLLASTLYVVLTLADGVKDKPQQIPLGSSISSNVKPTATLKVVDCTPTNITPTDLAKFSQKLYKDNNGIVYNVTDAKGYIQNDGSPNSLTGVVFGPNGPDANSYAQCVPKCAEWCDNHQDCWSFNVFTFQESDYEDCQVTCECRAVKLPFNEKSITDGTYTPYDPMWTSMVYSRNAYCFSPGCCFDPTASDYDECLWEAADIPGYIKSFYGDHTNSSNGIIYDIAGAALHQTYDCDITEGQGCPLSLPYPNMTDPDSIRGYLSVVALRRWMMFMSAKRRFIKDAYLEKIQSLFPQLIKDFTGAAAKPEINEREDYGFGALEFIATIMTWVAVPELEPVLAAFPKIMGVGIKVLDLAGAIDPDHEIAEPKDLSGMQYYFGNASLNMQAMIEHRAVQFKHNMTVTVENVNLMDGTMLRVSSEPDWVEPSLYLQQSTDFINSWTIASIFNAMGIFIHSEDDPGKKYSTYPGERVFKRNTDGHSTYAYPVYYLAQDSVHNTRVYSAAEAVKKYNIDWTDIFQASTSCQYQGPFTKFGENPWPSVDGDAAVAALLKNPDFNPATIPCLWNLPVCDSSNHKAVVTQCTNYQKCCTGHTSKSDTNAVYFTFVGEGGKVAIDNYNYNNYGLDDWCAVSLGQQGLWHSSIWKDATTHTDAKPFMGC